MVPLAYTYIQKNKNIHHFYNEHKWTQEIIKKIYDSN